MDADKRRSRLDEVTGVIIRCAYAVSNKLGSGFVEKVYENALVIELRRAGLSVEQQYGIKVRYDQVVVGEFAADLLVDESVIVELKAVKALDEIHSAQCLNYLKATGLTVCLLVNFGKPKAEIKRIVLDF
ncbi:MAG TPA: GxxExxY protein [Burkholderiales bacterium]|nr:GxxExxY protein [Burkholderiales bacterium]